MTRNNKKNKKKKILIIMIILVVLLLVVLMLILRNTKNNGNNSNNLTKEQAKYIEEKKEEEIKKLSKMPEQQRMESYCGNFFRLIGNKQYEEAYKLLYSEYKENYFPTLPNFKKYFEEYFPSEFSLSYQNMERLGDIYVLNVSVLDTTSKSFSLYVVIQENGYNDFVLSFSRNSAVNSVESEE